MESFSIQIQADEVQAAFIRLRDAAKDLSQAMRAITTALMSQTEANFAAQSGPSGPWPDLAESTRKRRGDAAMMLQDSGHLASSITPDSGPDFASIGTNVVYAAIHQLGGDIQRAPFSSWVRLREAKKNAASVRNFHAKSVAQTYLGNYGSNILAETLLASCAWPGRPCGHSRRATQGRRTAVCGLLLR